LHFSYYNTQYNQFSRRCMTLSLLAALQWVDIAVVGGVEHHLLVVIGMPLRTQPDKRSN
jgi:hypothetical protein